MSRELVIARAYGGEPLKRVAVEIGDGVVYVANPEAMPAVESGESSPVGFPEEDVFEFDAPVYESLIAQWRTRRQTNGNEWSRLRRYHH